MDKLKLGALGERLKTSGAQMGRMVSGKMKEMLQAPTPESKMVDEATSENLEEPNWSLNLRICSMLNSEEFNGTDIVKAVKKKIAGKNSVSQRLSLDLLETCAMNCEKVFSEIASEKVLDEMVKMIDNQEVPQNTRIRAFQLIRAWGESEDLAYLPAFRQTYVSLKEKATQLAPFPAVHEAANSSQLIHSLDSDVDQARLSPPERYPMPIMDLHGTDETDILYHAGSLSVGEKKELLVTNRNTVELLSSMLNETELNPMKKDDLMLSMLEKCKHSQPEIQMMIESTSDDDGILFEALNLNDELQSVISKFEKMEASMKPEIRLPPAVSDTTEVNLLGVEEVKINPPVSDTTEVNLLGVEEVKIKSSDEPEKTASSPKGRQSSESKTTG